MFIATRARRFTENNLLFTFLVLSTAVFVFVGGYLLFIQAKRSSQVSLSKNWRAWFIIGCYGVLALVSLVLTGRRARILALKLKRIPQKENDAPPAVRQLVQDEYWRTAAIAYISQPKGSKQEGWGTPGTPYEGLDFRRAILDTVPTIDAQARTVIPRLPALRPHVRMAQHLRALAALLPTDGFSCLHKYDSVVQLARYSKQAPTEAEFETGIQAYQELFSILAEYRDDQSDQA